MIRPFTLAGAAAVATIAASPAAAQSDRRVVVAPYIEATQTLDADLSGGDVLTYSSLAAGIDASIDTKRASAQISYRYERRFSWDKDVGDDDIHSGLARANVQLAKGLSVQAGGIATRTRSDIRGDAPTVLVGNVANVAQLYSVYGGPSYATQAGIVNLNAAYQIGYTKVNTPTFSGLAAGQARRDYYDDSLGQMATASAGIAPGALLPFGVTASGAYDREQAGQLSQRYEGYYGRGDVLMPVSPYVALTAGVGYEKIETSQKDPVVDATGTPVIDRNGRFETDQSSPRRIAYRTDGIYYDAGVVWRPNRRTSVEGHVGRRYGSMSYTGTATYQASKGVAASVNVYDSVQTFGRQLRTGLANLPTSFIAERDTFSQQYNGCVFSTTGTTPGGCLNDVFQSVSTASYRARGVDAVISAQRGRSTYGIGVGYANRKLFSPQTPAGVTLTGFDDESYYGQAFYAHVLTEVSGINANAIINYYTSGQPGADGVLSYGATGSYYHNFGRLGTTASVGLYNFKVGDFDSTWSAQALLGARYTF